MEKKDNTQEELISELKSLNETIRKQQTVFYLLRKGMLNGIGLVIGTSILAGIVISSLVYLFGDVPYIGSVVEQVDLSPDK